MLTREELLIYIFFYEKRSADSLKQEAAQAGLSNLPVRSGMFVTDRDPGREGGRERGREGVT